MQMYILTNLYETMLQRGNCSKLVLSCHSLSYSITFVMEFKSCAFAVVWHFEKRKKIKCHLFCCGSLCHLGAFPWRKRWGFDKCHVPFRPTSSWYLSPATSLIRTAASISFISSLERESPTMPMFDSRFTFLVVPGMGTTSLPLCRTQAWASWFNEHPFLAAIASACARSTSFFSKFSPVNLGWNCTSKDRYKRSIRQVFSRLIKPQYNYALICISDSSSWSKYWLYIKFQTRSGRGKEGGKVRWGEIAYIAGILILCCRFVASKKPMSQRIVRC